MRIIHCVIMLGLVTLTGCGVQNNVSFDVTEGNCADGTTNAPYCMAITLQNNSGGQNWINSTNFALQNLQISVSGEVANLNYPVTQGSAMDPNGCVNSTVKPGGNCTFYLQLTGESVPIGQSASITVHANYKIDNTLFGGSSQSASSSYSLWQKPNLVISNTNGRIINYSQTGLQEQYSGESGGSVAINANSNDNYYGFLYLATNNGLFLAGNQNFAYNKAESLININNIVINGNTAYPIAGNNIYTSSIKPIGSIVWSNYATAANVKNNTAISALGKIIVASLSNVFLCNSASSVSGGCSQEGVVINGIQKVAYTVLGNANIGDSNGATLTGISVGTVNGLFVESGTLGSASNQWVPVYANGVPINTNIIELISNKAGDIYAADNLNNIYKLSYNSGNSATLQTTLSNPTDPIKTMIYDNSGNVLYLITDAGNLYGCVNQNNINLDCGNSPVASNIFSNNVFGLNIITSLYGG